MDYLRYERNYSDKTVLAYAEDLRQLEAFVDGKYDGLTLLTVDDSTVREWEVSLMDEGYAPASVNRKLSALRSFYKFLLKQELVAVNPARKLKGPKNRKSCPCS